MTQLSEHFRSSEFDCHDGSTVPLSAIPALKELCVNMLEPLRDKYGPCKVLSGYRTARYNAATPGSARYSQHIYDDGPTSVAADVRFARGNPQAWARSARWRRLHKRIWRGRVGVGVYINSNFMHVDSASRRDWNG